MNNVSPSRYAPCPLDPQALSVVGKLHARSERQARSALLPLIFHSLRSRLRHGTWDPTQSRQSKGWLADKLVALDPHKAALCYLLCRSLGARNIVEAGTSFGASTIYLAAAIRDNLRARSDSTGGVVIGTEHEPNKVSAARANLAEAGLDEYVDIREGDLRETLRMVPELIDFMLIDIWIPMALPALELVTPHLRPGALVVCDNAVASPKQYADYLGYVRDPKGPFTSVTIPGQGGLEVSMKTRPPHIGIADLPYHALSID